MPIYEYRCEECGYRFSLLVGVVAEDDDDACPACHSKKIAKQVSRFRRGRSEETRFDEIGEQIDQHAEPDSPAAMREYLKEIGRASDDDMSDQMEEMFEADMEDVSPQTDA